MKAFPFSVMTYDPNHPHSPRYTTTWHGGMDLRDYFAAKAMQELIYVFTNEALIETGDERREAVAIAAYRQADAMMKARAE